ncbi:MAG: tetratricopeptide repeat protein [Alphaproteobacteria bacterium]|nr:tetratricopeptide repeat protein [Alphaproteobacteria bacterium]
MLLRLAPLLVLIACGGSRAQLRKGDAYLADGYPDAAARAYERALEDRPTDPELHLRLASAQLEIGETTQALGHARVAADAELDGAQLVLARALLANFKVDEAFAAARAAMEEDPGPEVYLVLGEVELARGQLPRALTWLERAAASEAPYALALHAWALARAGDEAAARGAIVQAQTAAQGDAETTLIVAAAWLQLGETADAQGLGAGLRGADPRLVQAGGLRDELATRAQDRRSRGDADGAYRDALAAFALTPEIADLSWMIGTWWLADGEPARAASYLEHALSLPPYVTAGEAQISVASTSGPDLAEVNAKRVEIARALAAAWQQIGDPGKAAEAMEVALLRSGQPLTAESCLALSDAYRSAGRYAEAMEMAARAADMGHPEAVLQVSRALAAAGRLDEAVGRARAGWRVTPGDPELALLLAELYQQRGELNAAREVLGQALNRHPDHPELQAAMEAIRAATAAPGLETLLGGGR